MKAFITLAVLAPMILGCDDRVSDAKVATTARMLLFTTDPPNGKAYLALGWRDPIPLEGRTEKIVKVDGGYDTTHSWESRMSSPLDETDEWSCGDINVYLDNGQRLEAKMILFVEKPRARRVTAKLNN